MKFDQTKPCSECPFRRKAPAGWLGASTPEEFIDTTLDDHLMPCHKTVDYEKEGWQEDMVEPDSKVQHCAGARIFYTNTCKRSKNPLVMYLEQHGMVRLPRSPDVFTNRAEFLEHHMKLALRKV